MENLRSDITFYLSIFASVLSMALAYLKIKEYRSKAKRIFKIDSIVKEPFDSIEINISNKGFRPITIIGYEVYYGNEFIKKTILKHRFEKTIKLNESDFNIITIKKKDLEESRNRNEIRQEYSCMLYLKTLFSTGENPVTEIEIDHSFVKNITDKKAIPYISADLFLGFDQMPIKFDRTTRRSAFQTGK